MNAETDRAASELLAGQLDAIRADLGARARPYAEAAELRAQRNSARRWAVDYEQTAAEMTRRVHIAAAFLADDNIPCDCVPAVGGMRECGKHFLERVLAGG